MNDHDLSIEYENIEKHINNRNFSKDKDKLLTNSSDISKKITYKENPLNKPDRSGLRNELLVVGKDLLKDDFWEDFISTTPKNLFARGSQNSSLSRTKSAYFENNTSSSGRLKEGREREINMLNTNSSKVNKNIEQLTTGKNASPIVKVSSAVKITNLDSTYNKKSESKDDEYATCKLMFINLISII